MKQVRCSVSRLELDAALKFSGLCITGEGENMKIARVPEGVREPVVNLEDSRNVEVELVEAEAKLSRLESKVLALEDDIAWLVDAMRRIGEQLKRC